MTTTHRPLTSLAPQPGSRLRVHLLDGQIVDGVVTRADDRTLRLRTTDRPRLVVVYRQTAARVEAA